MPIQPTGAGADAARKIEAQARALSERWFATAGAVLPAVVVAAGDFVPLTGARHALGGHEAGMYIGVECGRPAYRFLLAGLPATATELALIAGTDDAAAKWLSSVAFWANVRARGADRALRSR